MIHVNVIILLINFLVKFDQYVRITACVLETYCLPCVIAKLKHTSRSKLRDRVLALAVIFKTRTSIHSNSVLKPVLRCT